MLTAKSAPSSKIVPGEIEDMSSRIEVKSPRRNRTAWLILTVMLAASAAAYAQQSPASAVPDSGPGAAEGVEEVTVTARRVAENLQTTGVSVAAFTAEDLQRLNITEASDLTQYTPNLQLKAYGSSAADGLVVKIRGIGVSNVDFDNADPSVGVYIDGVFQARAYGPQFELFDVDQIEVLRGPQGTLYGKNSLGGAINIVTHKPDGQDRSDFDVKGGNYGALDFSYRGEASLIDNSLFGSISAFSRQHDGYFHNTYLSGTDPDDENIQGARAALRWLAATDTTVDLTADYTHQRQNAAAFIATVIQPGGLEATGIQAAGLNPANYAVGVNPSRNAIANVALDNGLNGGSFLPPDEGGRGRSADNATFKGIAATVATNLTTDVSLKSISAYRSHERYLAWDLDGTPAAVIDEQRAENGEQYTQELQLDAQMFDRRLDVIFGGFLLYEKLHENESNGYLSGLADTTPSLQSLSVLNLHEYDNHSLAEFAHAIWKITEHTRVTGGVRYSAERKTGDFRIGPLVTPGVFSTLDASQTLRFDAITPAIGIEHELSESLFTYVSASKGYASGGFNENPSALTGGIETYRPEQLWSYEIGFKSLLLHRTLRFNIAAFVMPYDNIVIQSFGVSAGNGGIGLETTNGGRARVSGFESELEWHPVPAFRVNASLGVLNQKFLDYGVGANGQPIDPSTAHFFDSPSTTGTLLVEYTLPVVPAYGTFTLAADSSYRARTWFDNDNTVASSQSPYTLLGARGSYTTPSGRLVITAFGSNLTDRVYVARNANALQTPFGYAVALFGPPRTFGIGLNYKLQ
jgi:iron complex outermembrane recepter protein